MRVNEDRDAPAVARSQDAGLVGLMAAREVSRLTVGILTWGALTLGVGSGFSQSRGPQPSPMPAQIAAPRDTVYLGTIRLSVDATDLERHILRVHETIPVHAGESTVLLYPQWLPGNHSPTGRVEKLTGLMIRANGARLEWTRDPVDVYAFHLGVPAAAVGLTG